MTVGVLLGKMGENNKFIREDADKALEAMVNNVSPTRALAAVVITSGDTRARVSIAYS